ncbi:MAG: DUF3298 domain-containing protein [Coxiellaceae bacterium]|nr:DUF3298 domain-containing protein [Coxiellaceae bacterium]
MAQPYKAETYKKTFKNPKRSISITYTKFTEKTPTAIAFNRSVTGGLQVLVQQFLSRSSEGIMNIPSRLNIKDHVMFYAPNKVISVQYQMFSYLSGAAHPRTERFTVNYDLAKNKPLTLRKLLRHPHTDLKYIAVYCMRSLLTQNIGRVNFLSDGAGPDFKNYQNWNLTKQGLLILFNPDQVTARIYGSKQVLIPYNFLKYRIKLGYLPKKTA